MERRSGLDWPHEHYYHPPDALCIPENGVTFQELYGVILCNKDYSEWRPKYEAIKDMGCAFQKGRKFERFLIHEVGVPKHNITTVRDATKAKIEQIFKKMLRMVKEAK